jgi:hypothetical protein
VEKEYEMENIVLVLTSTRSVITKLPNSLCPLGRIHHRTRGCKLSLLKVRKGKYKREYGRAQVEARS